MSVGSLWDYFDLYRDDREKPLDTEDSLWAERGASDLEPEKKQATVTTGGNDAGSETTHGGKEQHTVRWYTVDHLPKDVERAYSQKRRAAASPKRARSRQPQHSTLWQWAALFAGVLIQPYFQAYQSTHQWHFDGLWGWGLFALITSALIFPAVYRNAFDPGKPLMIQLAPIFASGLGWQSLLTTVVKVASRH